MGAALLEIQPIENAMGRAKVFNIGQVRDIFVCQTRFRKHKGDLLLHRQERNNFEQYLRYYGANQAFMSDLQLCRGRILPDGEAYIAAVALLHFNPHQNILAAANLTGNDIFFSRLDESLNPCRSNESVVKSLGVYWQQGIRTWKIDKQGKLVFYESKLVRDNSGVNVQENELFTVVWE